VRGAASQPDQPLVPAARVVPLGDGPTEVTLHGAPDDVRGQPPDQSPDQSPGLASLGIDAVTESAYNAMLQRPAWTLPELAGRLTIDPAATAQVVARLTELGLVDGGADGERLRPVRPQIGLAALIARREAELTSSWRQLEQGRLAAADLAAHAEELGRDHAGGVADMCWGAQARSRIAELLASATGEVIAMSGSAAGQLGRAVAPRWTGPAEGVRYRVVLADTVPPDPTFVGHLRGLAHDGAEVRTVGRVPLSVLAVDSTIAVLPVGTGATGRPAGVAVLRLPSAVTAVVELFGRVWVEATPLGQPPDPDRSGPGPRERELLALLVAGSTDESAAYRLGVSVRTVRRMVSVLMERLGARSRFQAGARAAERGWLDSSTAGL
jgi:DNA-binding CsgD family transcriptional regulator